MKKILAVILAALLITLLVTSTASARTMAPKGKTLAPENGQVVEKNIYVPDRVPWNEIDKYALGKASKASLKTLGRCEKTIVYSRRNKKGEMFASLICGQPAEDLRLPKTQGH